MVHRTENSAQPQSIDVTGLPDAAIQTVQSLVAQLRGFSGDLAMPPAFSSREDWANALRSWAESHPKRDALADDSRETIYAGRGE